MIITILVTAFLMMSAICTTVLIAACVVAKRSEEVIDGTTMFSQYDAPAEPVAKPITINQKPTHISVTRSLGKAVSS
jgi:hypothetical protein